MYTVQYACIHTYIRSVPVCVHYTYLVCILYISTDQDVSPYCTNVMMLHALVHDVYCVQCACVCMYLCVYRYNGLPFSYMMASTVCMYVRTYMLVCCMLAVYGGQIVSLYSF